jgi:membrane associated rhomboid family serine protease
LQQAPPARKLPVPAKAAERRPESPRARGGIARQHPRRSLMPPRELTVSAKKTPPAAGSTKDQIRQRILVLGIGLGIMWGLEVIDAILGQPLNNLGIHPRELDGLPGIFLSPVLHADFPHLIANTVPFLVLGFFVTLRGLRVFTIVTLFTALGGGLLVWLAARSGSVIGASGVIFGYFGYLMAMGIFERSVKSIALAVVVGLLYGGIIFGVVPTDGRVSWEAHLFGALAGVACAYLGNPKKAKKAA